jgi:hypothetical protein
MSGVLRRRQRAAPAEDAAALTLRAATPHTVVDALLEGILEALEAHGTVAADPLRDLDTHAVAGKEDSGVVLTARRPLHPRFAHRLYETHMAGLQFPSGTWDVSHAVVEWAGNEESI